jgi:hypothetical protein
LLTEVKARRIALGAGVPEERLEEVLIDNPQRLLAKVLT